MGGLAAAVVGMFAEERGTVPCMASRGAVRDETLTTLRYTLPIYRSAAPNFFHYREDYFIDTLDKTILLWDFQFNRFPCLGVGISHPSSSWSYCEEEGDVTC